MNLRVVVTWNLVERATNNQITEFVAQGGASIRIHVGLKELGFKEIEINLQ
jgi:hypothetical protein